MNLHCKFNLLLLTHPVGLDSTSMPRFANFIRRGMVERGHNVNVVTSPAILSRNRNTNCGLGKWLNYIDQFLLFPPRLAYIIRQLPADTLIVVVDQALGMLVHEVAHRPHVIHCHDFLAMRSARGEVPENLTSVTGKQYQRWIQHGFNHGKNFISVSQRTQNDLHRFLKHPPQLSEVVYNGLNGPFRQLNDTEAKGLLSEQLTPRDDEGFLLHVGGNQWYKNRPGVVAIYAEYCKLVKQPMPLWMIGSKPNDKLLQAAAAVSDNGSVRFLTGLNDEQLIAAYNLAPLFLFPSLDEGFGWPIAEAMACGTRVVTTQAAPMTEVGGDAAYYVPRGSGSDASWAAGAAKTVAAALSESAESVAKRIECSLEQSEKFNSDQTLDRYEEIYRRVLKNAGFGG